MEACRSVVWVVAIQVKVQKGWVTLTGKVEWQYQELNAEDAIEELVGIMGMSTISRYTACIGTRCEETDRGRTQAPGRSSCEGYQGPGRRRHSDVGGLG